MTATYHLKPSEFTDDFVRILKDTIANKVVRIEVRDTGEYYNDEGLLVREGVTVPAGEEDDPFYSAANIRRLNESIRQFERGEVVMKTMEELEAMGE
jgi:hypothetical protein